MQKQLTPNSEYTYLPTGKRVLFGKIDPVSGMAMCLARKVDDDGEVYTYGLACDPAQLVD